MLLPTLLPASALVLSASAFLLPLEFADKADHNPQGHLDGVQSLNGFNVLLPKSHTLRLDCSKCPFALNSQRHGHHEWTSDVESELQLTFSIEDKTLSLNGVPFYPVANPPLPPSLVAKQIAKESHGSAQKWDRYHGDLTLSYSLEIENEKFPGENADVVSIVLTIMGLDGQMVNVDNLVIKLIESKDQKIIHSISPVPASRNALDAKCTTIICRVLNKLTATMRSAKAAAQSAAKSATTKVKVCCWKCMQFFRGAAKYHHNHVHHNSVASKLPTHIHVKPGQTNRRPAHIHHHHGLVHSFVVGIKRAVSFVLFPILVGIAVGVTASAVGMAVGQLMVFLWVRYRRCSSSSDTGYERVESEEKEGLPAYEEAEAVDFKDEKGVKGNV